MISSEVQRTLVKSPPELWAELSDPAALARHLGELGEIRITRTEPEKTVEWEAENTTGTVSIQASGWGTRVTLSVTKELMEATVAADAELTADVDAAVEPEVAAVEPDTAAEPEPTAAAEPKPAEPAPEPRRSFFARLFGRKRKAEAATPLEQARTTAMETADSTTDEPAAAFAAVREALAPENLAAIDPFAVVLATQLAPQNTPMEPNTSQQPDAQPEQIANLAAELRAAEEVAEEEVTAVLAAVLDRLGAAHHRPFSRS
jgi:hypothetical protein